MKLNCESCKTELEFYPNIGYAHQRNVKCNVADGVALRGYDDKDEILGLEVTNSIVRKIFNEKYGTKKREDWLDKLFNFIRGK